MKLVIDMNLTPEWCPYFADAGIDAVHWLHCGDPRASDRDIMSWAEREGRVVLTHDLDFGTLLAATCATAPSVILLRAQDVLPHAIGATVLALLGRYAAEIGRGAIVVVDETRARVRVLPLAT